MYVMKRTLQTISLLVTMCFAFSSTGFAEEILLQHQTGTNTIEAPADRDAHGDWVHWDTGEIAGGVGLANEGIFTVAAFWEADELEDFDGYEVTRIRIGMWHEATSAAVKIWQGPNAENLTEYVSETAETVEQDWVEVELPEPYAIDTDFQLWIGWDVGDSGDGHFPAGNDGTTDHDGYANMIKMGDDPFVPITDLAEIDGMWSIQAFVAPADDDNGDDPETHEVTFNVDMATAEGFDPDEHGVFVTGNFADWAEPGTEGSLELEWAGKARTVETIMYENFDGGQIPDGWLNLDENGDGYDWTIVTDPGHGPYDGDYAVMSESWDGAPLEPDNWLITHQLTNVTDDWELSFYVKAQDPDWPAENYDVLISTTGTDTGDFTSIYNDVLEDDEWEQVTLSLADYAGEDIYIAFRHHDVTDMFQILIDAIQVEGTPGEDDNDNGEDPDDLIYTGVAQVEAGTLEYKYFSDAIDEGWDGGEWEGDPNREVEIDGDTVLHDVWGEYDDVSIVDAELLELSIYPNPASSVIHVEADNNMDKIQVYDVSGRMVMQMDVQDTYHSFDVSSLRNGFYIMQIHTEDGVEGRRFHVAK